jgi:nucleoid-associated protein YgaU
VLGVSLGLGVGGVAAASPGPGRASAGLPSPGWPGASSAHRAPAQGAPDPGWVATALPQPSKRPARIGLVSSAPTAPAPSGAGEEVVVRRGDCLWTLAARQLGADASDAQVATRWQQWWAANRAVIGDDPDLLIPGTRLVVPVAAAGQRR